MRPTLSLIRREFSAYFLSPIAYVVLAVFLAVMGHLFVLSLDQLTETGPRGIVYPMEIMVGNVAFWLVFLFIPPLLTMRLFAEERSSGTLEMLLTAPVRDWQVVFAKYFACFAFYALMWLPTLLYLPVLTDWNVSRTQVSYYPWQTTAAYVGVGVFLSLTLIVVVLRLIACVVQLQLLPALGYLIATALCVGAATALLYPVFSEGKWWTIECGIDPWPVLTTYIGLALAGAMFLSIGLLVSSLVSSQMIAAIVSLFLGLLFIGGMWRPEMDTSSEVYRVLFFFTVPMHFERHFVRGMIDSRQLILYGSAALFCLFLTVRSLESRRWR